MAIVVSDTTPLHYLILIRQDSVLGKLYGRIMVPPAVLQELGHAAAPPEVSTWSQSPPDWLTVPFGRPFHTWLQAKPPVPAS